MNEPLSATVILHYKSTSALVVKVTKYRQEMAFALGVAQQRMSGTKGAEMSDLLKCVMIDLLMVCEGYDPLKVLQKRTDARRHCS